MGTTTALGPTAATRSAARVDFPAPGAPEIPSTPRPAAASARARATRSGVTALTSPAGRRA